MDSEAKKGESLVGIESVKTAADVYAPVDCKITEANENLDSEPELLNEDPEKSAWLAKISYEDSASLDELMDQSSYDEFLKEENDNLWELYNLCARITKSC